MLQLSDLDMDKIYTYADYFSWKFEERVELIKGKIFKMSPAPNRFHQGLAGDIYTELNIFLKRAPCKAYIAPFDVRLPRKSKDDKDIITVLQPDVCVVCDMSKLDKRGCVGAPDIIVEVLSPGNNAKEMRNKYEVYEEAGVREYWVVSPQDQTFLVHILENGKFKLSPVKVSGDTITSSILPGFSLNLADMFRDLDPEKM